MKKYLIGFWYSLPIQLCLLHFKRYQIFLVFWYILFATIAGNFMSSFGAVSLFLAPEYMGNVSFFSSVIVGVAIGVFIMSWNITTFILHSKVVRFLATTAQPFLKYCINNAIIPMVFLLYYLFKAIKYEQQEEYNSTASIILLVLGFIVGLIAAIAVAFLYFFTADKTIYRSMVAVITSANKHYNRVVSRKKMPVKQDEVRVDWFLSAMFHLRQPRDVRHYSDDYLNSIFKRHHLASVYAILIAFMFLVGISFFLDYPVFIIPAAASITLLFAILVAVGGAFSILLKNWSIPVLLVAFLIFNYLYEQEYFDPRNKAYGLAYQTKDDRPLYNSETINALASDSNQLADKQLFLQRLNNWKQQQRGSKPIMYIINVSGGGTRSATFTMHTLQRIDSLMGGTLMRQTMLINGASGGMLGAAYYRELYLQKLQGKPIKLFQKTYVDDISKDLLNPLFSSFVARDILGPAQKFTNNNIKYTKDRGYAFEQQLNTNTNNLLDKPLKDYIKDEVAANIPTMLYSSVISRDGRKMIIGTQPMRFLMQPVTDSNRLTTYQPDAVDFNSLFAKQGSTNIRVLSALRMNATFPYVLPNVWLPTNPIIDVMDAGLRDNFGQETTLRFIETFKDWLQVNTSGVVLIQIRDRAMDDWDKPMDGNSIVSFFTKPFLLLQNNWFKMQDYYQHDAIEYLRRSYGSNFKRVAFQYIPTKEAARASLSFHLTTAEKNDIAASLNDSINTAAMLQLQQMMK